MDTKDHAVISFLTGLIFSALFAPNLVVETVLVSFIAGTLIDADHFLVGRVVHDDWRFFKTTFSSFWKSVVDVQSVVDEEADFPGEYRLFSHVLILVSMLLLSFSASNWLLDAAVFSVGVHILSDLYADCFQ